MILCHIKQSITTSTLKLPIFSFSLQCPPLSGVCVWMLLSLLSGVLWTTTPWSWVSTERDSQIYNLGSMSCNSICNWELVGEKNGENVVDLTRMWLTLCLLFVDECHRKCPSMHPSQWDDHSVPQFGCCSFFCCCFECVRACVWVWDRESVCACVCVRVYW